MPFELNWLDLVVIFIIFINGIEGYTKGFIKSFFNIAGFFISIYASKVMSPYVCEYIINNTGLDESLNKYFAERSHELNPYALSVMNMAGGKEGVGNALTSIFILIMSFGIVFIGMRLILYMFVSAIDCAAKLPFIKQFNRLGGLSFGIVKGALILYIVFAILTPIIPALSSKNPIITGLETSVFAVNFYKYNFIVPWIQGMLS